jgi:hypothetical protein
MNIESNSKFVSESKKVKMSQNFKPIEMCTSVVFWEQKKKRKKKKKKKAISW